MRIESFYLEKFVDLVSKNLLPIMLVIALIRNKHAFVL
jgi:hypothetical protein